MCGSETGATSTATEHPSNKALAMYNLGGNAQCREKDELEI
jgi:hypothetical protein